MTPTQDQTPKATPATWLSSLLQDIRYAARTLRKSPLFTAVIVLVLALGVGANAAIYSIVDAVVLQPLPGKDPRQLVRMYTTEEKSGPERGAISYPEFKEYRPNIHSLTGMAAYRRNQFLVSQGNEIGQRVWGATASGNFFDILGVEPIYGRLFSAADDGARGSNPVAVLSEGYWKRQFDGRPDLIGSTLRLNGHKFVIIGVAPSSVNELETSVQVWVPLSMLIEAEPMMTNQLERYGNDFFWVLGRLKPGISLPQAQAELDVVAERLGSGQILNLWDGMDGQVVNPSQNPNKDGSVWEQTAWKKPWPHFAPAKKGFAPEEGRLSWLLLGVAGLLLVIATADVAALMLARSEYEEKERAIRASLGASPWRLLRLQIVRGLLVAAMGAVAGLLTASWAGRLLFGSAPEGLPLPVGVASPLIGFRVAAFVVGISALAGVGCSLLPALRRRVAQVSESLKQQSSGVALGTRRGSRLLPLLVFSQIAASVVLLVGAALLIQTMRNVARIDLGYDTDHVLSASLDFSRQGYDKPRSMTMLRPIFEAVQSVPGARSTALGHAQQIFSRLNVGAIRSQRPPSCDNLNMRIISPNYFQTLKIPFLRGRDFTLGDDKNAPAAMIINQAAADLCWPNQDPIGKGLPRIGPVQRPFQVVGVVANVRLSEDNTKPSPAMYTPLAQFFDGYPWQLPLSILIRTDLPPHAVVPALTETMHRLDPNFSLYDVQTPREMLGRAFAREQFFMRILTALGILALVLAITGLYGMLAYVTAQRTKEFGIRLALGALPRQVFRLVLAQGGFLIAAGVIAGLVAAIAATRLLQSVLFGVSPVDVSVFAAVGVFFLAVGLLACFLPARRAMRVDPIVALRYE